MLINARLISNCAQVCVRVMCKGKGVGRWGRQIFEKCKQVSRLEGFNSSSPCDCVIKLC